MTLTREEIQALQPGRELDALIAEHVMGLDMVEGQLPQLPRYYLTDYEKTIHRDVPLYSSEISAAWEVVEAMKSHKYGFAVTEVIEISHHYLEGTASIGDYRSMFRNEIEAFDATAKTAPEAICKAALLAVLNL